MRSRACAGGLRRRRRSEVASPDEVTGLPANSRSAHRPRTGAIDDAGDERRTNWKQPSDERLCREERDHLASDNERLSKIGVGTDGEPARVDHDVVVTAIVPARDRGVLVLFRPFERDRPET